MPAQSDVTRPYADVVGQGQQEKRGLPAKERMPPGHQLSFVPDMAQVRVKLSQRPEYPVSKKAVIRLFMGESLDYHRKQQSH
jgi:hypothetical protein